MDTDKNVILLGRVGSHAYGLNTPESDEDFLGVFVAPTTEVAGLYWDHKGETIVRANPHSKENDTTLHEVAKFLRLCLRMNPTATELLWLNIKEYSVLDDVGEDLIRIRESFLSQKYVKSAYRGYASQQLGKFVSSGQWKAKHAWHCLRLIHQAMHLFQTGEVIIRVANPQVYWDVADMKPDAVIDLLKHQLDLFDALDGSPLPELPNDKPARDLLADIRIAFL